MAIVDMSEGIRATVEFPAPAGCTVADLARATDETIDRVWTSVPPAGSVGGVSEFVVASEEPPVVADLEHVLTVGDHQVMRLAHGEEVSCPCECLGAASCAVQRYVARPDGLQLVFNAADYDELRAVVGDLRERFPAVDVRRLVRSPDSDGAGDVTFVDRGRLTDRQLQVLRTAHEMGYFQRPRGANAGDVAGALDIDPSTFAEHLAAAQAKLFEDVLGDEG